VEALKAGSDGQDLEKSGAGQSELHGSKSEQQRVGFARRLLWLVLRAIARVVMLLAFRLRTYGSTNVPERDGVILAASHQSYLDPILVTAPLRRMACFMARRTLFRNRYFGALIRALNAFELDQERPDRTALREAVGLLRSGWCLVVFPEGTRTRDGQIGPLHPGVISIAVRAGAPIVPVSIEGAFAAWPRGGGIRPHPIAVHYGRPIGSEELRDIGREEAALRLRQRLVEGQETLRRLMSGQVVHDFRSAGN